MSVFLSDETKYMHGGTIVVNMSGDGATFTSTNKYEEAKKEAKKTA